MQNFSENRINNSAENNSNKIHSLIPLEYAIRNKIVPLALTNSEFKIGLSHFDEELINDLEFLTGMSIKVVKLSDIEIINKLRDNYGQSIEISGQKDEKTGEFQLVENNNTKPEDNNSSDELDDDSSVTLINQVITTAIEKNASDLHFEAYEGLFRVRYRIDGVLQEAIQPPPGKKQTIISRLKIMADLDIAEKRRPQDGRIRVKRGGKIIDIRISTLPTDFGEKIVLRILDKDQLNLDLNNLGFVDVNLVLFKKIISKPYGIILVTGPTGSGKTTTLYATLNHMNSMRVNILTIEDPIEYNLTGINQSQVRSEIGYNFAAAMRSFLRQDPDIIMVGEIRDQETAEIAIRSALTGHLVLSTLHTNNAVDTLTRLLDLKLEPFLISSSVKMIVAQRLMRKLCIHCKILDSNQENLIKVLDGTLPIKQVIYKGIGCSECNGTGYSGRTAIFEVMPISIKMIEAINGNRTATDLKKIALREGVSSLRNQAINLLLQGITSLEEVLRETEE